MKHVELGPYLADFSGLSRATPLFREAGVRAFLLHLPAGEQMAEHKVKKPITVQFLAGSVLFRAEAQEANLTPGSLLTLPAEVPHSLIAHADSLMLVTVFE